MKEVRIKSEGEEMEGTLFLPASLSQPVPGVIFLHGLTSSQKRYLDMARALTDVGIAALAFTMRGHGSKNLDSISAEGGHADALAAYDFLASQEHIDTSRIGLCGSSFGSMLAALISTERHVSSLLLRAPAVYTAEMMQMPYSKIDKEQKTIFRQIGDVASSPSVKALEGFRGSILVVSSEHDDIIPARVPQAYYDHAVRAKYRQIEEMKGATHTLDDTAKATFIVRMTNWFKETL